MKIERGERGGVEAAFVKALGTRQKEEGRRKGEIPKYRLVIRGGGSTLSTPVTIRFPRGWQGATPKQLLNSAEAILNQPGGGSGDPRYQAAKWVVGKFCPPEGGKERRWKNGKNRM